ncbi:galactofuranosylgalactofuranosylrhamnosyl-N-acetylglucosaminyl-diphospho-decaprenol beta-1,5/1,6-galactofuranosyltransferase [Clavibacter sp. B3I6]|uniref:glycosyltransferase n=1 Tax=Clavibacter sp. B3I6 TaxID=3042268 RepID=UPI00278A1F2B|nr:glycosyltransferase [Clavibacter sp. B3I6]MDQ0743784.1 galactofuranosylgalactofuranosylrhamnosyl-N-acetylglucosaminyl-diphospho-decaprenol beta-1,5/1,6-galactofuranosyltransferase [Clavibacter sp. B3I6]
MAADLAGAPAELDLIQRVILPSEHDPDIVPLYVDADYWTSIPVAPEKRRRSPLRVVDSDTHNAVVRLSDMGIISAIRGDRGFQVPHRRKVSFGTYFNAFPASYWRASTTLDGVVLEVETSGEGQVIVYRSNARGVIQKVDGAAVSGSATSRFELPFTYFADGGWYWFDLMGEEADFALVEAGWYAPAGSAPTSGATGSVSIAITTLNRAEYCVKLLTDIGGKPDVAALLDHVYVTDQGTQKVADQPAFPRAQELLGDKLRVIDQANLGGSGGFSRGMYETLKEGASDYVLVMDDDITLEPESIRRAVKFADYARTPTIVGGHMFDMYDKSKLHAYAEGFDMWNFMWGPVTPTRHDFSASNLRQTRWMHRRVDAEYNGWWMCLIPVSTIKEIGLSLPVFIKWDDAEYALRAKEVGVPTVTLPGAAVWHVSWVDKDDSQDWQAFFHARNRLIAALLHSPYERGGRFLTANLATDVRHLVSMQYFALAARHEAYRNILRGPRGLHQDMVTRLARTRELAQGFSDGVPIRDRAALPEIVAPEKPHGRVSSAAPAGIVRLAWLARTVARHALSPLSASASRAPEAHLAFEDARWWVVPEFDSVLVSNAEGSAALLHRRDPAMFRRMLWTSVVLRWRILSRWPQLKAAYRAALPTITSPEAWARTFGVDQPEGKRTKR